MINLEEAKDIPSLGLYTENSAGTRCLPDVNYWYCLDKIYESRGRCSECIHIGELGIYCRFWYGKTIPNGYCHSFVKGEPK